MIRTVQDIPSEALDLLALPLPGSLTYDQARGAVCVWGPAEAALTGETAVDLGEQQADGRRLFLRACHRHTGAHAYRALQDHAPLCMPCIRDASSCPTGIALRRLMRDARLSL
ncbi:hypothetical protein ACFXAZ_25905 [Streptomyces sp. NPDC059477]|uniref:hypothetical protein n=1 Tax=Streptomyces sp. NPDC059477 TaxID=3346847 RepID=UPI0036BC33E5